MGYARDALEQELRLAMTDIEDNRRGILLAEEVIKRKRESTAEIQVKVADLEAAIAKLGAEA